MRWLADIVLVDVIEGVPEGKGLDMLDAMLIQAAEKPLFVAAFCLWGEKFRHLDRFPGHQGHFGPIGPAIQSEPVSSCASSYAR